MISAGRGRLAAIGVAALVAVASSLLVSPGTALATPGEAGTAPSPSTVSVSMPTVSPQHHADETPGNGKPKPEKPKPSKPKPDKPKPSKPKPDKPKPSKPKPEKPKPSKPKPDKPKPSKPKPEKPKPSKPQPPHPGKGNPDVVTATVTVPDYTGVCPPTEGITATGVIKTKRPTKVTYVWLHNGKLVDKDVVKVDGEKTVSFTFTPDKSQKGRVVLAMLAPHEIELARDSYVVTCEEPPPAEPPVQASASVTAPGNYMGTCPVNRVFTGRVSVDRVEAGSTTVRYRWVGPDYEGPVETLTFAAGDPLSKEISHTVEVTESGVVERRIQVLSPNAAVSEAAQTQVECGPVTVQVISGTYRYDTSSCTPGNGVGINFSATIQTSGGTRVEYQWEFQNTNGEMFTVPGSFETTGPDTRTVSHYIPPSSFTAAAVIRVRLRVTSPSGSNGWVRDFTPPTCPRAT